MKIDHHTIQQLSTWISHSSVGLLELTTPESSLSLRRNVPAHSITGVSVTRESTGAPTHYELNAPGQPATREPTGAPTSDELTTPGQPATREPTGAPSSYELTAPGQPATREPIGAPSSYELTAPGQPATRKPAGPTPPYELTAPAPGIYLDRHPLSAQPLVSAGESIAAGQLVGFLQIRSLLIPLRSAQAGRIVNLPQQPGNRLGYGSVVMRLLTAPGS